MGKKKKKALQYVWTENQLISQVGIFVPDDLKQVLPALSAKRLKNQELSFSYLIFIH